MLFIPIFQLYWKNAIKEHFSHLESGKMNFFLSLSFHQGLRQELYPILPHQILVKALFICSFDRQ